MDRRGFSPWLDVAASAHARGGSGDFGELPRAGPQTTSQAGGPGMPWRAAPSSGSRGSDRNRWVQRTTSPDVLRGGIQSRQRNRLDVLRHEATGDGDGTAEAGEVLTKTCRGDSRVRRHCSHAAALCGQAALKLDGEQQRWHCCCRTPWWATNRAGAFHCPRGGPAARIGRRPGA